MSTTRDTPIESLPTTTSQQSSRVRGIVRRAVPPVALFIVVVAVWESAVRFGLISELILPRPLAIATAFADLMASGLAWPHIWLTLYETLVGFVLGAGLAFVVAVLSGLWSTFQKMIYPYMIALQVTPRIAIAPILIAWLGFGTTPKVVMAATICFFPVFINTLIGMLRVDEDALEMFRSMGATRGQVFSYLTLPGAAPVIFAGLKTGMTLALIGAIVGEFVSARAGLGLLIQRFSFQLNMDAAFAVLLILTILGLTLFAVMEYFDRAIVFWSHDERMAKRARRKAARADAAVRRVHGQEADASNQ